MLEKLKAYFYLPLPPRELSREKKLDYYKRKCKGKLLHRLQITDFIHVETYTILSVKESILIHSKGFISQSVTHKKVEKKERLIEIV